MAADERVDLGDEFRVAPEDQLRIDALLEAGEVLLSEPGFLQACERLLELGERRAAPQLQRSPEYRGRLWPGHRQRLAPVRMEPLEAAQVEGMAVEVEAVAGRVSGSARAVAACGVGR